MNYQLHTARQPRTVNVYISSAKPQKIRIIAYDPIKKFTSYVNRGGWLKQYSQKHKRYFRKFELPLPLSPDNLKFWIFNEANPKLKNDTSFKVEKFGMTKLMLWDIVMSADTKEFVKFAQQFAENAGVLALSEEGKPYRSDTGKFKINHQDIIRSKKNGQPITTPARISNKTYIIDESRHFFKDYTVAMRMIILMHEYSHCFLNNVKRNEIQADLNGLYVYLGLGYSPVEAIRSFSEVFSNADSAQNEMRMQMIRRYIKDFMTGKIVAPLNHNRVELRKAA